MSERPTPSSVCVCSLIALFADSTSPLQFLLREKTRYDAIFRLIQELVGQNVAALGSVESILVQVEQAGGEEVSSLMMDVLQRASCDSMDGLMDLMASLQTALEGNVIDASSQLGLFVRRTCLGFEKLSFEAATCLWEDLRVAVDGGESVVWRASARQMEKFTSKQALHMEEKEPTTSLYESEQHLNSLISDDPESPSLHFMRFLNCIQHGEKVGAIQALHQYFDYAMIHERKQDDITPTHILMHAAPLLLAATYDRFGDKELSLKATEEAVRIAQQDGESASIAYAMSLIFLNEVGTPVEMEEILKRCAGRASEGQLRSLLAGAHLSLARHLLNGKEPVRVWESLLNAATDRPADGALILDRPTHLADITSSRQASSVLAHQSLTGAGIWESLGFHVISGLNAMVGLDCFGDSISETQQVAAVQGIAKSQLSGPLLESVTDDPMSALESLNNDSVESNLCRYGVALQRMLTLDVTRPQVTFGVALVLHEWAVRRGEYTHAEALMNFLLSSLHSRMGNYRDSKLEVSAQHALLLGRQGHIERAREKLVDLCETCDKEGLKRHHAHLLIQLAILHLETSPKSQIGAARAIEKCLEIAEERCMDSVHATALSIGAHIHLRMGETRKALPILRAVLPTILQNCHAWFAGEAYLTIAKCHLHLAKKNKERDGIESALQALEKSRTFFIDCQDMVRLKEVYYLQARIYAVNEATREKRDKAADVFVAISNHLGKFSHSVGKDSVLGDLSDAAFLTELSKRCLPSKVSLLVLKGVGAMGCS